ncbi:transcriptional regulator with XRE-family HTH domain [Povalibacter uvarum]|uniref:Transcriptional regulator with XRE-family HTH domain n=1 Tax=Povalibacter uvarum TaxID=732238 RepID=A0A841HX55_9GAMM|nr:helix-turn-helix transcriptional regulator [Povalibacter uvarum]MBB6096365.1 transcriptional regulator with XRE-family HTH domain [Povalibacter uvarum]
MSESKQIVAMLKRSLKARGMTYADLASRVRLSEASIKRIFAQETFSLARLEQICGALGMSIAEVVQISAPQPLERRQQLTVDQEEALASDPRTLATFHLLLNGYDSASIAAELGLNDRDLRRLLVKLDAAKLIELGTKLKVRLRTSNVIAWRSDGPVRRAYEEQVKGEFLRAAFQDKDELLNFGSAELSAASVNIIVRKLEALARDFADLAALDASLPGRDEKRSMGLMLAMRPWVFSMYAGLRQKG